MYTNARIGAIVVIVGTILDVSIVEIVHPLIAEIVSSEIFIVVQLLSFVMTAVFFVVAALFVRRSLNELAIRSNIKDFATAGQTLFIGAILTLIIFGTIIMGIAFLILAKAFLDLKKSESVLITNVATNFCSSCGAPVLPKTAFCTKCGKQI